MYDLVEATFTTPRGSSVRMTYRTDTNDWNTLASCLTEDEYGLRDLHLTGRALDIGAYLGGVTVALTVDNPDLSVVAIEPVPGNAELLRRNVEFLGHRVLVVEGAAGDGNDVNIRYGYSGSELACHHAFVGNMSLLSEPGPDTPHTVQRMRSRKIGTGWDFAKVDCEGCEWDVDLAPIPLIHGEWHPIRGYTQADFLRRLEATHDVTFSGPVEGPGGFVAVRR